MQPRNLALMILALFALPACAVDDEDSLEFRQTSVGSGGGTSAGTVFNTHQIEDVTLSELAQPMGEPHVGFALEAVTLANDVPVDNFTVKSGEILAYDLDGKEYSGAELLDSEWHISFGYGLQFKTMQISSMSEDKGVVYYGFSHDAYPDKAIRNCPDGGDGHGRARVLGGFTLNQTTGDLAVAKDTYFIACTTGAVGKAAGWGYYDLAEVKGDIGLFEVAIRVVRADYGYDGVSWTEPGVPLLVEDAWGVRGPIDPTAEIEAVWGRDGLICAAEKGRAGVEIRAGMPARDDLPPCKEDTVVTDYPDALFLTRMPAAP